MIDERDSVDDVRSVYGCFALCMYQIDASKRCVTCDPRATSDA
jgi:hypothetical protein